MRVAIVEDEPLVARRLHRMLRDVAGDEVESVAEARSLASAIELLSKEPVDLLFLDLDLRGEDGFRLLQEAAASRCQTVVVSAHRDEALRAFEFGVTDFLAKPWSEERLRQALDRVRGREAPVAPRGRALVVRQGRALRTVPVARLLFVKGADDLTELHTDDGGVHLHQKTLAALEQILPAEFARVHRSYIVSLARVRASRPDALVLESGLTVPLGRLFRDDVRRRLGHA